MTNIRQQMASGFIFLDETGRLPVARDRFFAVGLIKCPEPAHIQRPMQLLRDRENLRVELKWSEVRANVLPYYKSAISHFVACPDAKFACFVADKQSHDPIARFGNQWRAYERLAAQLIIGNVARDEVVAVLADEYSTPATETFEENLRELVHRRLNRDATVGICRMRSTGVDIFQILDLILGAVAYEYKQQVGLAPRTNNPKNQLLDFVKNALGVNTFVGGYRDARVNVAEYVNP